MLPPPVTSFVNGLTAGGGDTTDNCNRYASHDDERIIQNVESDTAGIHGN